VLRYDFAQQRTTMLLDQLHFANGVALGPGDAYLLVNETGSYRILRYWLGGVRRGLADVFVDNLPGFPDNLTYNGRDRYWVALFAPRNGLLDTLAAHPFLRRMFARALQLLPTPVQHRSMAMAYDLDGRLVDNLQANGRDCYAPITQVREADGYLYFGSLMEDALGRLPLPASPSHVQ
jgi:sugar lactone lactonase YvrE